MHLFVVSFICGCLIKKFPFSKRGVHFLCYFCCFQLQIDLGLFIFFVLKYHNFKFFLVAILNHFYYNKLENKSWKKLKKWYQRKKTNYIYSNIHSIHIYVIHIYMLFCYLIFFVECVRSPLSVCLFLSFFFVVCLV